MEDNFPEEFLRGISASNNQFITEEGYPTQAAFRFSEWDLTKREDGYCELSINWLDDEGAISTLLNQMNPKKGGPQFSGGYCKIRKLTLQMALRSYLENGHLSYERRPIKADPDSNIPENSYHGNLLMQRGLSKQTITNIQCTLAGMAGSVIPRK